MSRPIPPPVPRPLAITGHADDAGRLGAVLAACGAGEHHAGDCLALVQLVHTHRPALVVCWLPQGVDVLLGVLAAWAGQPPCALCVIAPLATPQQAAGLADAGVAAWGPKLEPGTLALLIAEAQARFAREQALRDALAQARDQLDERKWVDRAKGLLMDSQAIGEDAAFKLLRGAAMHANLKLAEVSRSVIDAARWAEAVNRAGQLRMLSQRLVSLAAQRLLRIETAASRKAQAQQRAQANIDHLAALGLDGPAALALHEVSGAWVALKATLGPRADAAALARADALATALLGAADSMTAQLEAQGARRALHVVNLCGRQRMRSQRLAKQAFLAALGLPAAEGAGLAAALAEFEQGLREIAAAPLSSPEIRQALAAAQGGWQLLLRALDSADHGLLAQASDTLLQHLDDLTEHCEHSLQVLMS